MSQIKKTSRLETQDIDKVWHKLKCYPCLVMLKTTKNIKQLQNQGELKESDNLNKKKRRTISTHKIFEKDLKG